MEKKVRILEKTRDLPVMPGAYILVIDLIDPIHLTEGRQVKAGRYAYVGSAYGNGGIRARVRRHLRLDKTQHWHIDLLTNMADVNGVLALPGGVECIVVAKLRKSTNGTCPLLGFGSSDCRICESHLIRLPENISLEYVIQAAILTFGVVHPAFWQRYPLVLS